jgi:membrane protein
MRAIKCLSQTWQPGVREEATMDDRGEPIGGGDTHRTLDVVPGMYGRPPSWVILLSAALVAVGIVGRPRSRPIPANGVTASDEPRHQTQTRAPRPIFGQGWQYVLLRVYRGISQDRILLVAAGVSFYAILALFPGIGAIVSIYGLFADPSQIVPHLDTLSGFAPSGAIDVLREELTRLAHQDRAALGFSFTISMVISLWSANAGISALFEALTAVYEEKERRGLIEYYAITLVFTAGTLILVLLSLVFLIALPIVLDHIANPGVPPELLKLTRWPILFVLIALALSVIYRFGPGRSAPRWRWISWGSIFATTAWLAASALFSWYVANFGSYNRTYGSLGAIIGFMTWMWVSIIVVLVGAKLDAEMERRTAPGPSVAPRGGGATTAIR